MAELCVSSHQSSFLLRPKTSLLHNHRTASISVSLSGRPHLNSLTFTHSSSLRKLAVVSDTKTSSLFNVDSGTKDIVIEPEIGGGGGGGGGRDFGGGGGGGGGGGDNSDDKGEDGPEKPKPKGGMSMSQKLTLAYALFIGVGGVMGYLKSGSKNSLIAGGMSASILYLVYTELPKRTVFASCIGLGFSAALLVVMGSRFKRSGKIFPAGVISLVSLIMTGGYFHGILRGVH